MKNKQSNNVTDNPYTHSNYLRDKGGVNALVARLSTSSRKSLVVQEGAGSKGGSVGKTKGDKNWNACSRING